MNVNRFPTIILISAGLFLARLFRVLVVIFHTKEAHKACSGEYVLIVLNGHVHLFVCATRPAYPEGGRSPCPLQTVWCLNFGPTPVPIQGTARQRVSQVRRTCQKNGTQRCEPALIDFQIAPFSHSGAPPLGILTVPSNRAVRSHISPQ